MLPWVLALTICAVAAIALVRRRQRSRAPRVGQHPRPPIPEDPIDAFWHWWQTAKGPLAQSIEGRTVENWVNPISERVHAIHPRLAWELGPGVESAHHFCLSAEGDAQLRVTTERWLARAPAPDSVWEYYPARQPSRGDKKLSLRLGGVELDYGGFRFGLEPDARRRLVHVTVHHPKLRELDEKARGTAVMLVLDDTLGEDGVERWIGRVRAALDPSEATADRAALVAATTELAGREPSYAVAERKDDTGRVTTMVVHFGIKRLDHLLMDSHVEVAIAYDAQPNGLYAPPVGEEINAMQDALLEALGSDAVYIAHETGGGRRVIHLHVEPTGPALARITQWERAHPTWNIETTARSDPQWDVLRRW